MSQTACHAARCAHAETQAEQKLRHMRPLSISSLCTMPNAAIAKNLYNRSSHFYPPPGFMLEAFMRNSMSPKQMAASGRGMLA